MRDLRHTLENLDKGMLPVLAEVWDVNTEQYPRPEQLIDALLDAMTQPENAARIWEKLTDEQRGAMQTVLSSANSTMAAPMFKRMFGEFRKMGAGRIEREQPHKKPQSAAEALYYYGLIAEEFVMSHGVPQPVIYVPSDLIPALPSHKTAYDHLEDVAEIHDDEHLRLEPVEPTENVAAADTSLVDDMVTLLAYLRIHRPPLRKAAEEGALHMGDEHVATLLQHFLVPDEGRLEFMIHLGLQGELIEVVDRRLMPLRNGVRRWLSLTRSQQVQALANAWRESDSYRDLWYVPGLYPENGWPYDPVLARTAVLEFMQDVVPLEHWWSLDDFIITLKEENPDFQRPGGDYNSWYIRNDEDEYLSGFESWDAVEGALVEFYLMGPMHWLGLTDTSDDAVRLTAYGRALVARGAWPNPPEQDESIRVLPDGMMTASRKTSRLDRFQLARFTTWQQPATLDGDPYIYRLDAESLKRADEQGITPAHIGAFVQRLPGGNPLPASIARLLEIGAGDDARTVSVERALILRTTTPETLDFIYNTPALRRFMGARLGAMAAIVRDGQWDALHDALSQNGMTVTVMN